MNREKQPSQQKEEKIEQQEIVPAPVPEKSESRTDSAYFSSVQRYFNNEKRMAEEGAGERGGDDVIYEQYLTEQQHILSKLSNPKTAEKVQLTDVAFALAKLSGDVEGFNYHNPQNKLLYENDDKEVIREQENRHLEARKLYMESCKKLFPDTEVDLYGSQISLILEKLKRGSLLSKESEWHSPFDIPRDEIRQLLKENPRELLEKIDDVLYRVGTEGNVIAFDSFMDLQKGKEGGEARVAGEEKRLGSRAYPMYQLNLIKDKLLKKIYGNADMKPSEMIEVDKLKAQL